MKESELIKLKYPIGNFEFSDKFIDLDKSNTYLQTIKSFPDKMSLLIKENPRAIGWCYRPDGWNINQIVNHCIDSHTNAMLRIKWALTEDNPTIMPYKEKEWVSMEDADIVYLLESVQYLDLLHRRWCRILDSLDEDDLANTYFHPALEREFTIFEAMALYDWHCKHHYAHAQLCIKSRGEYNT